MAELINRAHYERIAKKRLGTLSTKHRRELKDLVGWPIDVNKVPQEFWDKVEREMQEELSIVLILIWMASADEQGMLMSDVDMMAPVWAGQRAKFTANGYAQHSRNRLAVIAQNAADGKLATKGELDDRLISIFGPSRDETVAVTETTGAITSATRGVRDKLHPGWKFVWRLGPCKHCRLCPLLADTDESVWGYWFDGPPAHPRCCCFTSAVPYDMVLPPPPSHYEISQAAMESGIFRRLIAA